MFPDNATDQQISVALKAIPKANVPQTSKAPTWADELGLNAPSESRIGGFMRGAAAGAVDLAQGATATIANQLQHKQDLERHGVDAGQRVMAGDDAALHESAPPSDLVMEAPDNLSGAIGSALPVVAEMALPGGVAVKAGVNALPKVSRASAKFQDVMGAARTVPIDVQEVGDVALRINQLAERGGSMPMAVRKLLNRMTDPEKAPLLYEESRDFASNISRLSANEFGRLTPAVGREVVNLRVALNKANALAAKQAGKLNEYNAAMREYAAAMRLRSMYDAAIKGVKQNAPWLTATGAALWAGKKLTNAISGGGGGE